MLCMLTKMINKYTTVNFFSVQLVIRVYKLKLKKDKDIQRYCNRRKRKWDGSKLLCLYVKREREREREKKHNSLSVLTKTKYFLLL